MAALLTLAGIPPTDSGPAAQRPSGPAAQRPSGPAAQRPSGPAAQRPSGMTCARREVGAPPPAASTPAGSARPDPRSGRRRARLSLLPLVLALLLGAPGLFAAAPAQAQTTIWSATLTVDGKDGNFDAVERGCSNLIASIDNCSRVLTDDDFTIQGTTYAVYILVVEIKPDPGDEGLYLRFEGIDGSAAKTALEALGSMVLHVDDQEYAVSNAQISGSFLVWPRSWRTHWLDGQKVKLRLTVPAGVPSKPGAFRLRTGDGQVAMHYTCGVDYYGKCQYRQKAGTNAWGAWTDIPESRSGGVNRASWTVRGLNNGTAYRFQLRGVNRVGFGPAAQAGPVTPATAPLPSHVLYLKARPLNGSAVLIWDLGHPVDSNITKFQYKYKDEAGRSIPWTDIRASHALTWRHVVRNLKDGDEYAFQVRAVNDTGPGPASAEARAIPGSVSVHGVRLSGLRAELGDDRIDLSWSVSRDGGDPGHTRYVVRWRARVSGAKWREYEFWSWSRSPSTTISPRVVWGGNSMAGVGNWPVNNPEPLKPGTKYQVELLVGSGYTDIAPERAYIKEWRTTGTAPMAPPPAAPALEWARVNGTELALRFDKGLDESSVPAASAFAVSVAGSARGVSAVSVRQDLVTLTLASAVSSGEAVTLGYAPPSSGGLRLSGGGAAVAAFSGQAVANDTPAGQPQVQAPAEPAAPLTASVASAPSEHRGKGRFEVRIAFSEAVAGRAKDAAIEVSGGTLARASRVKERRDLWALRIAPSGHEAVTVTLPATADCAAAGAVCTADGRRLETALTHAVPGPVTVSVADARAKEGEDATLDFAVTLSRAAAGEVAVTYATRDGTAKKGKDYRLAKGTLVFAAGETAKTVPVALLDDAVDEGEETLRLVLKKATGAVIADGEATGTIENDDPVPGAWLARFGRTVADQAVAAVRSRLDAERRPGFRGRIAGEALPDGSGTETAADGGTEDGPLAVPELAEDERRAFMALLALRTGEGLEPDEGESRAVTPEEALAGTAFEFVRETGDGLSLGLWGRVARSGFSGRAGELSLDGDVATALLGTDWRRRDALFGLMLFRSRGEGGYASPDDAGTVRAELSGLVPWAGLRRDGSPALWAAAGAGRGELTLAQEEDDPVTAGLRWSMAAAGAAGAVATVDALGGARVGWRADATATRTRSDAVAGLAASDAGTTRLRLGLEAAWAGTLSPRLEIGLRHDGGDAETGFGLEAGGGVRFADPARGLSASLDGRALALHEDGDLEDWGVSVSLEWDPRPETRLGPSVVATRGWGGAASGGVDALLAPETVPGLAAADGGAWSLEAAYGLRRGGGMAGVPHLRMGGADGLEELRLGYRIAPDADRAADASAEIWAEPGVAGTAPRAGAGLQWRW